ncbi:MAG TPA: glucose-6-phosphate isomerase [Candidatus Altiarchaeales archaeon]|nr:glucose-6-phosphate isomerase [Candidatus Altiarchaeales archaeon]
MELLKDKELKFGDSTVNPDIRMLSDMNDVIYDREWLATAENIELYYMYRDLALNEKDRETMRNENLRYDITIIPANNLGREFVKTIGHYHPEIDGVGLSYTEIYEVIEGEAHYLLQGLKDDRIMDVVLVKAKKGDKIIIPPNYGHITINPSKETLVMANYVSDKFSSIYDPIRKKRGGAYFELIDGNFIKNQNYNNLPPIRIIDAQEIYEFGITRSIRMYDLIKTPEKLKFLNEPHDYEDVFNKALL